MSVLTDDMRRAIEQALARYPSKQAATLPALHIVHDALRHVPAEAICEIAELLELHPAEVHDAMSFYGFFRESDRPLGRKRIWVCRSLSCMLRGGEELLCGLCAELGIAPGETTPDGRTTLEFAECLGACEGAPCVLVEDECHMNQTVEAACTLLEGRA
jgi:NADH-quinone oxidoreductase subunit E